MNISIEVPDYTGDGIKYNWVDGFEINVQSDKKEVRITANKEGLLSMANHLLNLAQDKIHVGFHMHFDRFNSLEDDALGLIIEKQ